jgi:hypothetical protein
MPTLHVNGVRILEEDDGTVDDFLARNVRMAHFEALDSSQWYLTIELASGAIWQLSFGAQNPRAKGYARVDLVRDA